MPESCQDILSSNFFLVKLGVLVGSLEKVSYCDSVWWPELEKYSLSQEVKNDQQHSNPVCAQTTNVFCWVQSDCQWKAACGWMGVWRVVNQWLQMPKAKLELSLSFSLQFYFSKRGFDTIKMSMWSSKCHHFEEIIFSSSLSPLQHQERKEPNLPRNDPPYPKDNRTFKTCSEMRYLGGNINLWNCLKGLGRIQ